MSSAHLSRKIMSSVFAVAAAVLATGCAASSGPASGSIGHASITERASASGETIHVQPGDRVTLILASTYWRIGGSSAPGVLRPDAPAVTRPVPSGCVPGQGCGSVRQSFTAMAAGTAVLTAHRDSCGEALRCTGSQGDFRLVVAVG